MMKSDRPGEADERVGAGGRDVRVLRHPRGWAVVRTGNVRPSRVALTKERALHIAKAYAREERGQLIVEDDDGPAPLPLALAHAKGGPTSR